MTFELVFAVMLADAFAVVLTLVLELVYTATVVLARIAVALDFAD